MSKQKQSLSDYKKIIQIQEKKIKKIESERDQVEKLFHYYNAKSIEGWSWYGRYYNGYNNLVRWIRNLEDRKPINLPEDDKINPAQGDDKQLKFDFGGDDE